MSPLIRIRRALLSVSDKTHLLPLAEYLHTLGCELISTGGTRALLESLHLPVTDISKVTGNPEAFGGRMKTISFAIESALLYDRERDAAEAQALGIAPIDLVVCNLYPFAKVLQQGADFETLVENIDIGGPTMVRAAAKNFKGVAVVTDPEDYAALLQELQANDGATTLAFRQALMAKAFNHTADYDALVAQAMDRQLGKHSLRLAFEGGYPLRYGENSHQKAQFFRERGHTQSLYDFEFLHGKELSYNNILDVYAAVEALRGASGASCAIVKHNNPCGLAQADTLAQALALAWEGDPVSAFGSIIAFNQVLDEATVRYFDLDAPDRSRRKFVEVVIAPAIEPAALAYLQQHKNLRVLVWPLAHLAQPAQEYRFVQGALLVQDRDEQLYQDLVQQGGQALDLAAAMPLLNFGLRAVRAIKSNTIALVREVDGALQLLGMGAGQPNRLVATRLALEKAKENLLRAKDPSVTDTEAYLRQGIGSCWLVSDAFFPFEDNVELAAEWGVTKIVQPGGSIRDKHVIETAEKLGITMVFSGLRHFKH